MHLAETDRLEAFSDGVFAIVVTLLVLDLKEPVHAKGQLLAALGRQWPAYLAYFASFAYVAVIWLNHHQTFVGIQRVNRGVHFANLSLLFTTALIPFPTAVLSHAFIAGIASADARTAVGLYSGIAAAMCASWLLLYHQVHRHHRSNPSCDRITPFEHPAIGRTVADSHHPFRVRSRVPGPLQRFPQVPR